MFTLMHARELGWKQSVDAIGKEKKKMGLITLIDSLKNRSEICLYITTPELMFDRNNNSR